MNSIHNNGESDKSLNEGLDRLGRSYGKLDQDEPPELLDQAVLSSAHRAVEKKPHWMKFTWLQGLTTTAVFVLAFSLILNQRESAPVFENGMGLEEPVRLQSEKTEKKQSLDAKAVPRKEMKLDDDARQDDDRNTPINSAPESEAKAGQSRSRAMESRVSGYVQDVIKDKAEPVAQDMVKAEPMLEEIALDEVDFMADAPVPGEADQQFAPTAVATPWIEPGEAEAQEGALSKTQAEQELLKIIELRQSGDPGWKAALQSFMENYPGYPLPQELKGP